MARCGWARSGAFTTADQVRFRYRLLGATPDWIEAGSSRQAYYANLRPGDCRFEVQAGNKYGVWSRHLAALIRGSKGFECAGQHVRAERALKNLPTELPDVVLLDLELPGMSGIEFIRRARSIRSTTEILALTMHDEARVIFEALEAGATGYLVKPVAPAQILEAIAEVLRGGSPMSSQIARLVIRSFHRRVAQQSVLASLTPREEEILRLLSRGYRYQEIAEELGIAVRTVSTHLHHIYGKLHVRSATEATAKFLG